MNYLQVFELNIENWSKAVKSRQGSVFFIHLNFFTTIKKLFFGAQKTFFGTKKTFFGIQKFFKNS